MFILNIFYRFGQTMKILLIRSKNSFIRSDVKIKQSKNSERTICVTHTHASHIRIWIIVSYGITYLFSTLTNLRNILKFGSDRWKIFQIDFYLLKQSTVQEFGLGECFNNSSPYRNGWNFLALNFAHKKINETNMWRHNNETKPNEMKINK